VELIRDFPVDLSVRSDGAGRTIHGIVVPYGTVSTVADYPGRPYKESFARGAFARDIAVRNGDYRGVKLLFQHDKNEPIGRATMLSEDTAGLYGEFKVSDTARGNEALNLIRDGVLDSFSAGFLPQAKENKDGVVVRTQAAIRETSVVTFPAYAGALIGGVRFAPTQLQALRAMMDMAGQAPSCDCCDTANSQCDCGDCAECASQHADSNKTPATTPTGEVQGNRSDPTLVTPRLTRTQLRMKARERGIL
jgi:HK97 family phage prohead protease